MTALERAIYALLAADTGEITLAADAVSTTVVNVPVASWASLYLDAHLVVKSNVSATATNDLRVVRVTALDGATHRATIDPALAVAPKATDVLRLGVVRYLKAGGEPKAMKPSYSTPVQDLLDSNAARDSVVLFGEQRARRLTGLARESVWELRAVSRSTRHAEACCERIYRLLHGGKAALQAQCSGVYIGSVVMDPPEENERDDSLSEWQTRATITAAVR